MSSQKRQPWPERFTERFHIFALGEKFDVDALLSQSTLRSTCVWRQMGNGPTNGLELLLGDAQSLRLPEQEKIAIDYLKEHREELRALGNFPGVEALNLGFQYRAPSRAIGVCVGPSKGLMFHALEAGVRVNYYITLPRHRAD